MKMVDLQEWIRNNLLGKTGKVNTRKIADNGRWLRNNYIDYYNIIIKYTDFLSTNNWTQRIWHILNECFEQVVCKQCGEPVKFLGLSKGYNKFCSEKCSANNKDVRNKCYRTKEEKYGDSKYNNREKNKLTVNENWGVDNVFQCEQIKEKICENNVKEHGVKHNSQREDVKEKIVNSNQKNLGVKYPFQNKNVQNLRKRTMEELYGSENPSNCQCLLEKKKQNYIETIGVEHHTQKALTNLQDLNKDYILQNFINQNNNFKLHSFQQHFSCSVTTAYRKLHDLGVDFDYMTTTSDYENQLHDFLKNNGVNNIITNTRKIISPSELDIYLPDYNLAIEFNGLFYHGELTKPDRNFHLNKTEQCEKLNIQLIHIFQQNWDDWFKQDIMKSMLLYKVNKIHNKIYARKCSIKSIDTKTKNDFLNLNHIQGQCQSSINLGLYLNDELVSIMTFSKSRFNKKYYWELLRFCNKKYTNVIGAASKLLNFFTNNYKGSIITYADRTYSNGKLYEVLGFEKIAINNPSYHYYKHGTVNVLSRLQCQKRNLPKLIEFDPNLTEWQNMLQSGYNRYWDCGTITYVNT